MKGDVGIEFIIVIILAVLVLTLGTGFLQNIFKQVDVIGTQVTDKAINELINQLSNTKKEVGTTIGARKVIDRNQPAEFAVVINNGIQGSAKDSCFKVFLTIEDADRGIINRLGCADFSTCTKLKETEQWFSFAPTKWLSSGKAEPSKVSVNIPAEADSGDYIFRAAVGINSKLTDFSQCNAQTQGFTQYGSEDFILQVK